MVHLPTTLLAATDSILSCKQGVNGEPVLDLLIKNLVGTFKAPELALVYLSFWQSLAPDEIRSGLCELVKNVLAIHPHRYEEVAALLNPQASYSLDQFAQVFAWCFEAKQAVMRQDAHEQGAALVLEAGHTVGHALVEIPPGGRVHPYAEETHDENLFVLSGNASITVAEERFYTWEHGLNVLFPARPAPCHRKSFQRGAAATPVTARLPRGREGARS